MLYDCFWGFVVSIKASCEYLCVYIQAGFWGSHGFPLKQAWMPKSEGFNARYFLWGCQKEDYARLG